MGDRIHFLCDESGLVFAHSVGSVCEVSVRIMNMNGEPIVLKKGARVASAEAADAICSAELDKKVCIFTEHLNCPVQGASEKLTESERDNLTSVLSEYPRWTDLIRRKTDTGDANPVRHPPQRLSPTQRKIANQETDKDTKIQNLFI